MTRSELNSSIVNKPQMNADKRRSALSAFICGLILFCFGSGSAKAQSHYSLRSPDQRIEVRVRTADRLSYDVLVNGSLLLQNSTLSMTINHTDLGTRPIVRATKQRTENKEIISPVPQKSARIRE